MTDDDVLNKGDSCDNTQKRLYWRRINRNWIRDPDTNTMAMASVRIL